MPSAWINGQLVDENAASVSIRDTGLLHAAGVFTTMRAAGTRVFRLAQHLRRLRGSCQALGVPLPYSDDQLTAATEQLLRQRQLPAARLRLTVTRGTTGWDASHAAPTDGSVFLTARPFQTYAADLYTQGMTVVVADQKLNPYDIQAGHKTLNYFSRLAALQEARQRGAGETLWENVHGFVESGSISNIFLVKDGRLLTPPTRADLARDDTRTATSCPVSSVLPGITRELILELAEQSGMAVDRRAIDRSMLMQADECFLTNSLMGVMPVCHIQQSPVAAGKPGEHTTQIMRMYEMATGG